MSGETRSIVASIAVFSSSAVRTSVIASSSSIQLGGGSLKMAAAASTSTAMPQCTFIFSSDLNAEAMPCAANRKECQNFLWPPAVFLTISGSTRPEPAHAPAFPSSPLRSQHPDDRSPADAGTREQTGTQAPVPGNAHIPEPAPAPG